jgi:hypothetical protein
MIRRTDSMEQEGQIKIWPRPRSRNSTALSRCSQEYNRLILLNEVSVENALQLAQNQIDAVMRGNGDSTDLR